MSHDSNIFNVWLLHVSTGCLKKVPHFDLGREQNYKVSGIFEFITTLIDLQFKCTSLAF